MNERAGFFCRFAGASGLRATVGGTASGGGCSPPDPAPIDWILVSPRVEVRAHVVDRSDLVRRTTDHPVVVATLRIDPADFPGHAEVREEGGGT